MNIEDTIPRFEKDQPEDSFRLDTVAQKLIEDETLLELAPADRGVVIVDRFIGSLVRHGRVQGSNQSYAPKRVLEKMDNLSRLGVDGLREITRTDGLKDAARDLALDQDAAKLFGSLSERLAANEEGGLVLTSVAQIEGYLLAGGSDNNYITKPIPGVDMPGVNWIPVVAEYVQKMSDNDLSWITDHEARELTTSSSDLIHNTGRDWAMAKSSALKAGVDMDLIARSAEYIKQERKSSDRAIGSTALFLATGSAVDAYQQSLHYRSHHTPPKDK